LPFLHDSAYFCKKFQPMKLILEIKNPGEWEALLAFLQQKGIDFRLTGKKQAAASEATAPKEKLAKDIQWRFSDHVFQGVEHKTFSREEIYEDADWEKNLH